MTHVRILIMKINKQGILAIFENPQSKYFGFVNDLLAIATIVSILTIVLETVPSLFVYESYFLAIELITVLLFSAEYIFRLWANKNRSQYAFSFFGIIDLIAILPTLLGLGNLTFLKSARIVRIIRFLRLVRLSRLSKIKVNDAEETMGIFGFNIALYAFTLLLVTLIFGVILHVFDVADGRYWSIPAAMFWTFSVFLGGLPTPIPPGTLGTAIFIGAKFCGMALFGLLIGVVGKIFNGLILGKSHKEVDKKKGKKKVKHHKK